MAPESDRAEKCRWCGKTIHLAHRNLGGREFDQWTHEWNGDAVCMLMVEPESAPATCSEVVERLAACVHLVPGCFSSSVHASFSAEFNRELATLILDEWRERRVQELEEALREMVDKHGVHSGECFSCDFFVREVGHHSGDCPIPRAEKLLANSEWREQIRKGAKHE